MSFNFLDYLREKLEAAVIKQVVALNEPATQSQTASDGALPAVVAAILEQASTEAKATELLQKIQSPEYDAAAVNNADAYLSTDGVTQNILNKSGPETFNYLFGDNLEALARALTMQAGISEPGSANMLKLYSVLSLAALKHIVAEQKLDVTSLRSLLAGQAALLKGRLMDSLCYSLGWGTAGAFLGDVVNKLTGNAPAATAEHVHTGKGDISKCPVHGEGITWPGQKVAPAPTFLQRWWWLIPLLILLVLIAKSCSGGSDKKEDSAAATSGATATTEASSTTTQATATPQTPAGVSAEISVNNSGSQPSVEATVGSEDEKKK